MSRVDTVNRVVFVLLGVAFVAGGATALLAAGGTLGDWIGEDTPRLPLLTGPERSLASRSPWFWPVVGVAASVLALLSLRWLLAQAGTARLGSVSLPEDRSAGTTRILTGALTAAVVADVANVWGVSDASARMFGTGQAPLLKLDVSLSETAQLPFVRERIESVVVPRARQAMSLPDLAVQVRLKIGGSARRYFE
jgi:anti-sigma factor RsiW